MEMVENRTVYLALDQFRDELPGSNIKGRTRSRTCACARRCTRPSTPPRCSA